MSEKIQKESSLCPKFSKTFGILGRKWNGLIIDVLLENGPQRFKNISEKIPKCSDRVLVERLRELEDEEIIEKVPCNTCRNQYQLTERGKDLRNVMTTIHEWSDKWYTLDDCK